MCDPLTIAGLALTAGSAAANTIANNQVASAQNNYYQAERDRQKQYQDQAFETNDKSLAQYNNFGDQQAAKASQIGDTLKGNTVAPTETSALPSSSSKLVVSDLASKEAANKAFTDQQGNAAGNVRAFGDLIQQNNQGNQRNAGILDQLAGFERGSANAYKYETDAAQHAGDTAKLFGDLLGAGGTIVGGFGSSLAKSIPGVTSNAGKTNLFSLYGR